LLGFAHDSPFPGKSLAAYWESGSEADNASSSPAYSEVALRDKVSKNLNRAPAWRGPMQSVVGEGKAYIRNADGREELYDILGDPAEVHDLAGSIDSQVLFPLRQVLQSAREETRLK
jgi:hypothetical protein